MYTNFTEKLSTFGCTPISGATLDCLLTEYHSPKDKVSSMVKQDELLRLKRDLYCVSPRITGQRISKELIANHLYGPSYISLETALAYHKLIPERVEGIQSVVSKRAKTYRNSLGIFTYTTVPSEYFSIGVNPAQTLTGQTFLIASPEKALCDLILLRPNLRIVSEKAMRIFLTENMRIDLQDVSNPNLDIFDQCIATGRKNSELLCLRKVIKNDCL